MFRTAHHTEPHYRKSKTNKQGLHKAPIRLADAAADSRIVFSPHVYGPSVYMQDYFKTKVFMCGFGFDDYEWSRDMHGRHCCCGGWKETSIDIYVC
jgi:hypothetical protein